MTQPQYPRRGRAPRNRLRAGMTLVETVVALFIAVFLIASILSSVVFASRQFTEAKARTNATNIINQQMEVLRSLKFSDLNTELAKSTGTSANPIQMAVGNQGYRVWRSINFVANLPGNLANNDLVRVVVTVQWEIMGRKYTDTAETYFSKNGFSAKYE